MRPWAIPVRLDPQGSSRRRWTWILLLLLRWRACRRLWWTQIERDLCWAREFSIGADDVCRPHTKRQHGCEFGRFSIHADEGQRSILRCTPRREQLEEVVPEFVVFPVRPK